MKRKILMIVCLIICLFFISQIIINIVNKQEGTSFYNSTLPSHNEVDLDLLKADYPSVQGYIDIEDTNISYPIVQGENNEYYLTHLPNGEKNKMGSIYLDYRNDNFNDDNTIIYGHNMNDETMFSELENYKDQKYSEKHKYYNLYTSDKKIKVEIVAAYIADAAKESLPINFTSAEDKNNYLNKVDKANIWDNEITIDNQDKIISLVTCADIYDTSRLVLIGKVLN